MQWNVEYKLAQRDINHASYCVSCYKQHLHLGVGGLIQVATVILWNNVLVMFTSGVELSCVVLSCVV